MNRNNVIAILSMIGLLFVSLYNAGASELPPQGSKPLSAILRSVEEHQQGSISAAEFDDGF